MPIKNASNNANHHTICIRVINKIKEIMKEKTKHITLPSMLLVPSIIFPDTLCLPNAWPNIAAAASPNPHAKIAIIT